MKACNYSKIENLISGNSYMLLKKGINHEIKMT